MQKYIFFICMIMLCSLQAEEESTSSEKESAFSGNTPPRQENTSIVEQDHMLFILSADYILWLVKEGGLAATASQFANTGLNPNVAQGIIYPKFKTRSGFKIGAGVAFDHNDWSIFLQYTWFYNKGNPLGTEYRFAIGDNTNFDAFTMPAWLLGQPPAFPLNVGFGLLETEKSSWNNFFNRLEGVFSQLIWGGKNLIVRPFLGILGWWDSQKLRIEYETFSTGSSLGNYTYHLHAAQDGSGAGPYIGQEIEFCFYNDQNNQMGICGKWGGALLWSQFKATALLSWDSLDQTNQQNQVKQKSRNVFTATAPMLETVLGFRWTMWFGCNVFFRLQIGWELSAWFDHNHMFSNLITRSSGTCDALYTMQGLTVNVQVGF